MFSYIFPPRLESTHSSSSVHLSPSSVPCQATLVTHIFNQISPFQTLSFLISPKTHYEVKIPLIFIMGPLSKLLRQMGLISNTPTTITQKKKGPNWSTIYKSSSSNRKQPLNCIFKSNCLNLLIQLHGTETKLETTKTLAICFQSENLKVYFYLIWLNKVKTQRKKNEREKWRVGGFIYIYQLGFFGCQRGSSCFPVDAKMRRRCMILSLFLAFFPRSDLCRLF